jgi:ribosomal protein S18 acetylase RimI-like enzyme
MSAPDRVRLGHAESDAEVLACFPLMRQLRPHLASAEDFLARVRRQASEGYRLLVAWEDGTPVALGGYRIVEMLVRGRFLYVDDLVTTEAARGRGLGALVLRALAGEARAAGLPALVLDTAADNTSAHRFYEREGMRMVARRYATDLA